MTTLPLHAPPPPSSSTVAARPSAQALAPARAASARMASLDAFRGFTIASMMLVNNPGDWGNLYAPLEHAKWNGWTFTDWVFPFFLFIGGFASTISLGKKAASAEGNTKRDLFVGLAKRAGIIFAIGFALNVIPYFAFDHVRVMGVLQRIALTTLLCAPLVIWLGRRGQVLAILSLFALYSALMLGVAVPDATGHFARGALEPGRDFGAFVDRSIFGKHLWVTSKTWDPEGLVSTLPAIGSQLMGVLAGQWMTSRTRSARTKMIGIMAAGVACAVLGEVMGRVFMPINKSLWTPSYAVAMTGWACLVFGAFFWIMDGSASERLRSGARRVLIPFNIFGMNALFLFALSALISKMLGFIKLGAHDPATGEAVTRSLRWFVYEPIRSLPLDPKNASLLFAILFNLVMFAVAWGMWRKKWFVKV